MDRRIQVVITRMETHISTPQNFNELAQHVNLSLSRVRHLFKRETGQTPAQYLKCLRMQKAEFLLRTTFLNIKEIINRIGMINGSHFVREFKKIYGVAPTKYRSKMAATGPIRNKIDRP